ncbi:MAG: asparagine synthase (glutamine-hydrolyzing) [Chitinophagaceae bacterium]
MCGIVCVAGRSKLNLMSLMLDRIKHRGPDGNNIWQNENFALGHARLSIIDLSTSASQPMIDEDGNVLIFNGEIYNYVELKNQLSNQYHFKTESDTEVILAAYKVWKEKCVEYLRGMFSIVLFDKNLNKLFIARDRFGIKPLYFRKFDGAYIFSSEIKSLIQHQGIQDSLNEKKAFEFLVQRRLDTDTDTFISEVKQLKQGCYVWVDTNGEMSAEIPYWKFPALGTKEVTASTYDELYEKLNETVKIHLRSDVPVGSFLSGGVDSSTITALCLQNVPTDKWHTFSAVLPYFHPENSLIEEFHSHYKGIHQHNFQLTGEGFFDDIEKIIYHHDEPILDGSMYAHYKLCKIAADCGVKVVLSGSGGDELFAGYRSYIDAGLAQKLKNFEIGDYFNMVNSLSVSSKSSKASLIQKSLWELLPFSVRAKIKQSKEKDFARIVTTTMATEPYPFRDKNPYQANLLNNFYSWTVPPFLHYEDRNCMAFGVEVRVPLFDHELVEFVLQYKYDSFLEGNTKSVLRKSVEKILPEKICNQKGKYGFPSPIDHALQNDKKGREMFFDNISNVPFINKNEVVKLADDFYKTGNNLELYWRSLCFAIWYNSFFK